MKVSIPPSLLKNKLLKYLSWLNISQNYALVFVLVFLEPSSLETLCQSRFNIFARAHCTFFLLHCATWSRAAAANALCCIFLGNLHWLHSAWLTCLVMCFIKLPAFPFLFCHHEHWDLYCNKAKGILKNVFSTLSQTH